MSRSYWHIIAAVIGWLIVASTASGQQNPTQEKPKPKGEIAQSMDGIAAAIKDIQEHLKPDAGCPNGAEDRNSDLCAQWKAADAAKESAEWTEYTFHLGVVGAGIGLLTLVAAGVAAYYAKRAAVATEKTEKAAWESVAVAQAQQESDRASTIVDQRAWVVIRDPSITHLIIVPSGFQGGDRALWIEFSVTVENVGKTPAQAVCFWHRFVNSEDDPEGINAASKVGKGVLRDDLGGYALAPGESRLERLNATIDFQLPTEGAKASINVWGVFACGYAVQGYPERKMSDRIFSLSQDGGRFKGGATMRALDMDGIENNDAIVEFMVIGGGMT